MKICVVIVTFNKLECLKKALISYEEQSKLPQCVIVVNNNSTDGTKDYLEKWTLRNCPFQKIVINLPQNTGGAGGFNYGMEKALTLECDWIWVSDDDAYLEKNTLKNILEFEQNNPQLTRNAVALCSKVINYNKKIGLGHRTRKGNILGVTCFSRTVPIEEYEKEYFSFDYLSYVGSMIRKSGLQSQGLPNKDLFIYFDDFEHSIRLRRSGMFLCIPSSCVIHEGESDGMKGNKGTTWRDYYATRNVLLSLKWHYGMIAFFLRALMRLLTALKSRNIYKIKMFWKGIVDAKNNIVGIDNIYKPGWKKDK